MMMKKALITCLGLLIAIALVAVGLSPGAAETPSDRNDEPAGDPAQQEEEVEYHYDPEGKTDPFEPFVVQKEASLSQLAKKDTSGELQKMLALLEDLKRPKTELQTIPLSGMTLTSIVKSGDSTLAMVKGPQGGKGYLLEKGTYIGTNGGVVEEIISEERMTDLGKQLIRKVVIKEPYLDADRRISYRRVELKMPGSFE